MTSNLDWIVWLWDGPPRGGSWRVLACYSDEMEAHRARRECLRDGEHAILCRRDDPTDKAICKNVRRKNVILDS